MRGMKERWCFVHVRILGRGIEDDMGGMQLFRGDGV